MGERVKVRVALAVDPAGEWNAVGWAGGSDNEKLAAARDLVGDGERCYWLEAQVEVPTIGAAETWSREAEPTMLAALVEAESALAMGGASYRTVDQDRCLKALENVRAAIAKARVPSPDSPSPSAAQEPETP